MISSSQSKVIFVSNLLPGDLVLADRGFNVREFIHSYQADIKLPAFTLGK